MPQQAVIPFQQLHCHREGGGAHFLGAAELPDLRLASSHNARSAAVGRVSQDQARPALRIKTDHSGKLVWIWHQAGNLRAWKTLGQDYRRLGASLHLDQKMLG